MLIVVDNSSKIPKLREVIASEVRRTCLRMVVNGMGYRGIERVTGVHHTTIINWHKEVGKELPDSYEPEQIPEVGEINQVYTFVGKKKQSLALDGSRSL